MTSDVLTLVRLLQVSDTSFPSGGFAFSSGLETLVNEGRISGAADVGLLLAGQVLPRWAGFDRPFLHAAHAAAGDCDRLLDIDRRCHLQSTADRLALASRRVGRALLSVHARIGTPGVAFYRSAIAGPEARDATGYEPVVQGLVGAGIGLSPALTEAGALHSVVMAFVTAAIRLGRLGALEAQSVLAGLAPAMAAALSAPVQPRPSAFSPYAEIAALRRNRVHASLFAT
jgi:urease accessory protein